MRVWWIPPSKIKCEFHSGFRINSYQSWLPLCKKKRSINIIPTQSCVEKILHQRTQPSKQLKIKNTEFPSKIESGWASVTSLKLCKTCKKALYSLPRPSLSSLSQYWCKRASMPRLNFPKVQREFCHRATKGKLRHFSGFKAGLAKNFHSGSNSLSEIYRLARHRNLKDLIHTRRNVIANILHSVRWTISSEIKITT